MATKALTYGLTAKLPTPLARLQVTGLPEP